MSSEIGERIVVLGSSGSGKTVLARELAERLGVPHVELDALRFAEDWVEVPDEVFIERIAAFTEGDAWVVDGNYSRTAHNPRWDRAQTIVWLDLPRLWLAAAAAHGAARCGTATARRSATPSRRDSILLWFLRTFRYEARPATRTSPSREAGRWLAAIPRREGASP